MKSSLGLLLKIAAAFALVRWPKWGWYVTSLSQTHRPIRTSHIRVTQRARSTPLKALIDRTVPSLEDSFPKKETKVQNIAVVGAGAVGSYYGARLWEAGHSTQFHMRGENYTRGLKNGLKISSIDGDIHIPPEKLNCFENTATMDKADWVIVALKSSALNAIADLIVPLLKPTTRILVIMNGLVEEDLIQSLRIKVGEDESTNGAPLTCCKTLYGGMALICSNRVAPAVIDHSYAGLLSAGIACTQSQDISQERAEFEALWEDTKVPTSFENTLAKGRWKKMVWNLPFNGISVSMGGISVDKIVNDPGLRDLAWKIMDETIAVANAELTALGVSEEDLLTDADKEQMMALSDGMGPYRTSTMIDLIERRPMEVKYLFRKPIEKAHSLGVAVPHLETLVAQIEAFQNIYDLY